MANFDREFDHYGEPMSLKHVVAGWASKVNWLRANSMSDSSVEEGDMIHHDFIGILHWRNELQRGLDSVFVSRGGDEWALVKAIDSHFVDLTALDHFGCLKFLAPDLWSIAADVPWWRVRIPRDGSIGFEFAAVIRRLQRRSSAFREQIRSLDSGAEFPDRVYGSGATSAPLRNRHDRLRGADAALASSVETALGHLDFLEALARWARSLNALRREVIDTPSYLEGSLTVDDYTSILKERMAIREHPNWSQYAAESAEVAILNALEAYFLSLTVHDSESVLAEFLQLTSMEPAHKWDSMRIPKGGSIAFELTAAARRVRGIYSPLDD